MDKIIVSKEEFKINKKWKIKLISYDNEGAPYRMLTGKNEFVILDKNNFGSLHGRESEDGNVSITYMDTSLEITILEGEVLITNSR